MSISAIVVVSASSLVPTMSLTRLRVNTVEPAPMNATFAMGMSRLPGALHAAAGEVATRHDEADDRHRHEHADRHERLGRREVAERAAERRVRERARRDAD